MTAGCISKSLGVRVFNSKKLWDVLEDSLLKRKCWCDWREGSWTGYLFNFLKVSCYSCKFVFQPLHAALLYTLIQYCLHVTELFDTHGDRPIHNSMFFGNVDSYNVPSKYQDHWRFKLLLYQEPLKLIIFMSCMAAWMKV